MLQQYYKIIISVTLQFFNSITTKLLQCYYYSTGVSQATAVLQRYYIHFTATSHVLCPYCILTFTCKSRDNNIYFANLFESGVLSHLSAMLTLRGTA